MGLESGERGIDVDEGSDGAGRGWRLEEMGERRCCGRFLPLHCYGDENYIYENVT